STPRTDAPTDIGQPAVSGFVCDDDPSADEVSRSESDLASVASVTSQSQTTTRDRSYDWTRDAEPVSSTLQGFQEIALIKALKTARGRDRSQILKEYLAARTKGGAKYFMRKVAMMTKNSRLSAVRERKPGFLSLFRPMPQLRWLADPIGLYRRPSPQQPGWRMP